MSDYNGWKNRETWLVNVWFNPESLADLEVAQAELEDAYSKAPDFLRDFINLVAIDWDDLREHFNEEEETES